MRVHLLRVELESRKGLDFAYIILVVVAPVAGGGGGGGSAQPRSTVLKIHTVSSAARAMPLPLSHRVIPPNRRCPINQRQSCLGFVLRTFETAGKKAAEAKGVGGGGERFVPTLVFQYHMYIHTY